MILNNPFTWIGPNSVEYREGTLITQMRDFSDKDYWYIDFFSEQSFENFKLTDLIPQDIITQLQEGNVTLVLVNGHEAFHRIVDPIYKHVVLGLDIDEDNVILLTESPDILSEVDRVSKLYNLKPIKCEWMREFEYSVRQQINHEPIDIRPLECKHYDKKFINLNRRWRLHRPTFVAMLQLANIIDKGFVSLAPSDDGFNWEKIWDWMVISLRGHEPTKNIFERNEQLIKSIPHLYIDTKDLVTNHVTITEGIRDFYRNSYFSIVSETNYYTYLGFEPARFVSEKTFKPIAECHPFLLLNPPYSLRLLRELGYKTFSPYIDESYDDEINDVLRMNMIIKEVERLSNLSDDEVNEFINNVRDITIHNYNLLKNKTEFITRLN